MRRSYYGSPQSGAIPILIGAKGRLAGSVQRRLEAAAGIEPANSGFADRCLNHLATPPPILLRELRSLRSTRNFGTSRAAPNPSQFWSGRGDSNSRPSAWQADALPTELLPHLVPNGAGKGIRTPDPQLGKLMLYRLSYSRPPLRRCRLLPLSLPLSLPLNLPLNLPSNGGRCRA